MEAAHADSKLSWRERERLKYEKDRERIHQRHGIESALDRIRRTTREIAEQAW